jgi:hypothetical protein
LNLVFDKIKSKQRNIVETIFSIVKRKLGETLSTRTFRYQVKEIKIKLIIHNINKKVIEIICIKLRISTEPDFIRLKKNYFGISWSMYSYESYRIFKILRYLWLFMLQN